jgi:hypothetical protein
MDVTQCSLVYKDADVSEESAASIIRVRLITLTMDVAVSSETSVHLHQNTTPTTEAISSYEKPVHSISTRLHGVTFKKTVIFIATDARTSNHKHKPKDSRI